MPRKTAQRYGYEPDDFLAREQMEGLIVELNQTWTNRSNPERSRRLPLDEGQEILRAYISRWMASGPNLRRLFKKDPELASLSELGTTTFWPGGKGRGYLDWRPILPGEDYSPQNKALREFITLIANPKWTMLAGPCKRCGDYFLKKTSRSRRYCSKTCGAFLTASSVMKEKRARERKESIARALEAMAEWEKTRKQQDWKQWVAKQTGLSLSWLTRAVTKGDLQEPQNRKSRLIQSNS